MGLQNKKINIMRKNIAIGIDIGGTNTVFGIFDEIGHCYYENRISTIIFPTVEAFVEGLTKELKFLLAKLDFEYNMHGIGIGAPNGNFFKGTIEHAPNLAWKGIVPLASLIEKSMNCKVVLSNDANAAAIGEMQFGKAKGIKNFVLITLGTGLGSGIVIDGKLLYGHTSFAGELGHVTVYRNGRLCGCGRNGCLETYVSASGIVRTVQELMAQSNLESSLRSISNHQISAKIIYEAACNGDEIAIEAFNNTGRILGVALANVTAVLSPEAIFLLGGLTYAGDLIFKPTLDALNDNVLNVFRNTVRILPSGLNDNMAAIAGAAALAWNEIK